MSVRKSLAWSYSAQALNFIVAFGSSVIIARLVTPREFGIFAMAASISAFLALVFGFGLSNLIVRDEEMPKDRLRSILAVSSSYTSFLCILLVISGLLAKHVFDSPDVGDFLMVYALVPAIQMFELIPEALCRRHMRFKTISAISVMKTIVTAAATIVLAKLGFKHMSFAYAGLVATIASVAIYNLLYWQETVYRPRLEGYRSILTFGLQMVSINGFGQLNSRISEMTLGSWLGLSALGLYSRASNLANQLQQNVYGVATGVIFVRMSMDFRETGRFDATYLRALRILLAVVWPMMLGMAVLSYPFIQLLYGEKWLGAALPLSFLMLAYFTVLGIGMQWQVFILRKETGLQTKLEGIRAAAGLAMFCVGCLISLPAAAAARIGEAIVAYLLYRPHMDRLIGIPRGRLDRVYGECLTLAAIAVLPSLGLMLWSRFDPRTPLTLVAASVVVGVLCWAALLVRIKHPVMEEVQFFWRRLRRSPRAETGTEVS
ncbi:oligosaccharide flippase family protein [Sphingomonas arenae]|uniref:oligosaccharide flippase family protein n=1 Tax=Sphingomonas arenae TaxID=2812555 RepID=UPI001967BAE8|nr:oligosaccharide flippase family protein [Sphingomonas arenae]